MVDDVIAQKLLALYWHHTLEIDESKDDPITVVTATATTEGVEVTSQWVCCGKTFKSERAMKTHQQISGCRKKSV